MTLTAPYGHAGSYRDLEAYLRQHLAPGSALADYQITEAALPTLKVGKPDFAPDADASNYAAIAQAAMPVDVQLDDGEIAAIMAFLKALEDPIAVKGGRMPVPDRVPSGLPFDQ
ncbi:MAG: hypothetical protein ACOH2M_03615 [Cypionkella sp.]